MNEPSGLRERKKEATRQALHEAAVRLAVEHGPEQVTVEAIADAAGVSRRTFSNYFEGKEQALLYSDRRRLRRLAELMDARPPGESAWTALAAAGQVLVSESSDPRWLAQLRLVKGHPALLQEQVVTYGILERTLADRVAARLPDDANAALVSRLLAATFLATLRVSTQHWLSHPEESLATVLARALDLVGSAGDLPDARDGRDAGDAGDAGDARP
jgi:AcrR family transcriptional regulator